MSTFPKLVLVWAPSFVTNFGKAAGTSKPGMTSPSVRNPPGNLSSAGQEFQIGGTDVRIEALRELARSLMEGPVLETVVQLVSKAAKKRAKYLIL